MLSRRDASRPTQRADRGASLHPHRPGHGGEQFAEGRLTLEEFQRGLGALATMAGALEKKER